MKRATKWLLSVAALFVSAKALRVVWKVRHPEAEEGCHLGDVR
jgi:hypothetical protein